MRKLALLWLLLVISALPPVAEAAAPDGVVVFDWTTDHAAMCQAAVMAESGLDAARVPIKATPEEAEATAIAENFKIISQSSACSAQASPSAAELSNGLIGVGQHCTYDFATPSTYFLSVAASATAPSSTNLEFITPAGSDSQAIAYQAGKFFYAWSRNPTWDVFQARAAMRQASSNYPNWVSGQGFGVTDKLAASRVASFDLFGPIGVTWYFFSNKLTVTWVNFALPDFGQTYLVKFATEPGVDALPSDGTIIYQGTGTTADYSYSATETSWFALFTESATPGTFSKCYPINKRRVTLTYTPPAAEQFFFDNTRNPSVQDGLTWETAWSSFPYMLNSLPAHNKRYLKASDIPYVIGPPSVTALGYLPLIGGCTGSSGTDTTVGGRKSFVTPSMKIAKAEWTVYSGNTYCCTPAALAVSNYGFANVVKNVFSISGGRLTALTKGSDRGALAAGQWFYTDSATSPATDPWKIYANWGAAGPPGDTYFVYYMDSASRNSIFYKSNLTATSGQGVQAQNVVFFGSKYGGHVNTTGISLQYDMQVVNCEFRFNEQHGLYLQAWTPRGSYAHGITFDRCRFGGNTQYGVSGLDSPAAYGYTDVVGLDHIFRNCVFDANTLGGAKLFSRSNSSYTNYIRFYFYQCLFYANGGKGLWLADITGGGGDTEFFAQNNISLGNTDEEFYADDTAGVTMAASNNCNGGGSYGGKWEANKGGGNVEADPLLRSDFAIPLNSPACGAGFYISGFHDAAGRADFYGRLYQPATGLYTFSVGKPAIGPVQPLVFVDQDGFGSLTTKKFTLP